MSETDASRTVLVRMRHALPTLRPAERRIAEAFLDDPSSAAQLSVAGLAARCATSTASVLRFSQRIGYAHYRDLRMDIARESTRESIENAGLPSVSGDIDRHDSLDDIVSKVALNETLSIADTAEVLDRDELARAVELVRSARRIDTFGLGASSFVGLDLQQKLTRIGRTALNWPDSHAAWTSAATLDDRCVALAISHSGSTIATVEFLSIARESGAAAIAITNFEDSALADAADVVLLTAARETRFRSGALGSRIAQLMVVDCLFTAVAQSSFDESMAALQRTYDAVHSRSEAPR